jgi:hypothetical protein
MLVPVDVMRFAFWREEIMKFGKPLPIPAENKGSGTPGGNSKIRWSGSKI